MTSLVNGCNITLKMAANESTSNDYVYILPRGYFDNTFKPIVVTDDDGKKYNVIPSDQFK